MDSSSFFLGGLFVAAKVLGIGAVGFAIAWWRGRNRIRQLEARQQIDPRQLLERMDRLEDTLDSVTAALERLSTGQGEMQRRLPPRAP
ncbi:MAG TPA: hypothetical protein VI160_03740 [Gemmatimonadales bacterium]